MRVIQASTWALTGWPAPSWNTTARVNSRILTSLFFFSRNETMQ